MIAAGHGIILNELAKRCDIGGLFCGLEVAASSLIVGLFVALPIAVILAWRRALVAPQTCRYHWAAVGLILVV